MRKLHCSDEMMAAGLTDADLGSNSFKNGSHIEWDGKSGGLRTIIDNRFKGR